ncbi:MAG: TRAP transporter large permease subunit [Rhizobiaceae bacterium]|nr:TRAP transporter large permease subunit [Rhizobiaceae bacterium]
MGAELATLLIFVSLIVLLLSGVAVPFALMGVSIGWLLILQGPNILQVVPATIFETATTEIFIAAPLFIFMASCLERSGIGSSLYEAIYKWSGGLPGGMAVGTILAATLLDAMTGVGGTAVLVLGVLAIPEMIRRGYHPYIAIGGLPPAGALGVLIPPTVIGVLLGGFTGIPVGSLFFGGFLPGLLCSTLFCVYIVVRCGLNPELAPPLPRDQRPSLREKIAASTPVIVPMALIMFILGTIWLGVATPTEAAGIGAMATVVIMLVRNRFNLPELYRSLFASARVSVMVVALLIGGALFTRLLQMSGSARMIADMLIGVDMGMYGTVLIFIAIVTLLGMFIDGAAIIFIVSPIMMPVITALGIDQVWFGVLIMVSIAAGYVTPPFGMNLFYMKGIMDQMKDAPGCEPLKRLTMTDIWRASFPYVALMYAVIALILIFPEVATWLPSQMR